MAYLRGLRNAKNLRSTVLQEFIAFGEIERKSEESPQSRVKTPVATKQQTEPPRAVKTPTPLPPGDDVTITQDEPETQRTPSQPFTAAPARSCWCATQSGW